MHRRAPVASGGGERRDRAPVREEFAPPPARLRRASSPLSVLGPSGLRADGGGYIEVGCRLRSSALRWSDTHKYGSIAVMKTTLEIPEPLFRRAKLLAARDGKTLKQLVNEALEEKLRAAASAEPPWRGQFGKLRALKAELSKVDAAISEEFEKIDPDEWA
jgi:hypothetical protein